MTEKARRKLLMLKSITFLISCLFSLVSVASEVNIEERQAEIYKAIFDTAEQKGIDKSIFAAIILQESGDPQKNWEINPYALNLGGYSFYPDSKAEAYKMLIEALMEGEKQLGVGAGQMEWVYHSGKFNNLWEALDFLTNLDKASDYYLKMIKLCDGDQWCAAGKYHNQYPQIAAKYEKKVREKWLMVKEQYSSL